MDILRDLESFDLNVMDVADRIRAKRLRQFPEVMKNLQVIIEFSDCIIQAKDLLEYDIVIDEDENRMNETKMKAQQKLEGLPNQGRVEGV